MCLSYNLTLTSDVELSWFHRALGMSNFRSAPSDVVQPDKLFLENWRSSDPLHGVIAPVQGPLGDNPITHTHLQMALSTAW